MSAPSTDWREEIAADEDERFERHGEVLRDIQRRQSQRKGSGRALHRKQHVGVEAELEVLGDLPAAAAAGLFAAPGRYRAYARFSNGSFTRDPDSRPDLRGLAIKVLGVDGRKLIPGMEDATTQDFLLINTPVTPFAHVDDFIRFMAAVENPLLALPRVLAAFGPRRAAAILRHFAVLRPPASLATIRYYSAVPVRWGDHAGKYGLLPADGEAGVKRPRGGDALAAELAARLRSGPLRFDFAVQLYSDPQRTPIEDASVEWDSPFVTVARLEIPAQDVEGERGRALGAFVEGLSFDPWHALEAHRPLGNVMRARNNAYRLSTIERHAAPEPDGSEQFG